MAPDAHYADSSRGRGPVLALPDADGSQCGCTVGAFYCHQLGPDPGAVFLNDELTLQCWSSAHVPILALACFMLVVYVFGLPVGTAWLLRRNQAKTVAIIQAMEAADESATLAAPPQEQLSAPVLQFRRQFSFTFLGYATHSYFWESVEMIKKALLSLINVVYSANPIDQVQLGMLLMFCFIMFAVKKQPLADSRLNDFELFASGSAFCMLFFGYFTLTPEENAVLSPSTASTLVVVVCGAFVLATLLGFLWLQRTNRSKRKAQRKSKVQPVDMEAAPAAGETAVELSPVRSAVGIAGATTREGKSSKRTRSKKGGL